MPHGTAFRFNETLVDAVIERNPELANEIERRIEEWLDNPNFPGPVTMDRSLSVTGSLSVDGTVDFDGAIQGDAFAWTAYTPTWTSTGTACAIGNGSVVGRYVQLGDIGIVKFELTGGSTTTWGTGAYRFSLPAGWTVNGTGGDPTGVGFMRDDSSSADYPLTWWVQDSGNCIPFLQDTTDNTISSTNPFTLGTDDTIRMGPTVVSLS